MAKILKKNDQNFGKMDKILKKWTKFWKNG